MPKLASRIAKTKKNEILQHGSKKRVNHKEYPRSYRLDAEIMGTLKETLDKINKLSPKKVTEARLVKALILISKELEAEKILKALKEVW
jgi:hypothetical protein